MPNGGSDCCGTCWFNAKNKGETGYSHARDPEPAFCIIRQLPIVSPFYTYCANHPHHNRNKIDIPIGPVFTGNSEGQRELWVDAPDSPEIRDRIIELLGQIVESPPPDYPFGLHLDEQLIIQAANYLDARAIPDLERISNFNLGIQTERFTRNQARIVALAKAALAKIRQATQGDTE
jgi:hypothetical protein